MGVASFHGMPKVHLRVCVHLGLSIANCVLGFLKTPLLRIAQPASCWEVTGRTSVKRFELLKQTWGVGGGCI